MYSIIFPFLFILSRLHDTQCMQDQPFVRDLHRQRNIYTVEEQSETHFNEAIRAYQHNDIEKSIRIFEFLSEKDPVEPHHPLINTNLALLYHQKKNFPKTHHYARLVAEHDKTNLVGNFLLANCLYIVKNELYNAFMAFRNIGQLKYTLHAKEQYDVLVLECIIEYNMALILYKLGGVQAAETHLESAIQRIRFVIDKKTEEINLFHLLTRFQQVKRSQGIGHTLDLTPMNYFRLFTYDGQLAELPTKPLRIIKQESPIPVELRLTYYFGEEQVSPDPISKYYFTDDNLKVGSVPLPPAHKIAYHMDHQLDYFSPSHFHKTKATTPTPQKPKRPHLARFHTGV